MKILLLLLVPLLAGCDGIYVYTYEGTLLQSDRTTPARHVPIEVTYIRPHPTPHYTTETDDEGHFQGTIYQLTGWIIALRPPAPKLEFVDLLTPLADPITIPLRGVAQPIVAGGRQIHLPPTAIPPTIPRD